MSGKAQFRLFLLLILAGLAAFVGYRIFRARDPMEPFHLAEKAYTQEGLELYKKGEFAAAAAKFDEANVLLEHTLKRLNGPNNLSDKETAIDISGRTLYLKALALRDKHYALAAAAGKPLEETRDSAIGGSYRNFLLIPDSKEREEAAGNIRGAAMFLTKDADVQLDALRLELVLQPIQWDKVETLTKTILNLKDGKDSRALYLLAKYEFEQPMTGSNLPMPLDKRSTARVEKSLELVTKVYADPVFPIWRTKHLEAQIRRWLMAHYQGKLETKYFDEMNALESLLLDDFTGAVSRIRAGESLQNLSTWDSEGVLGLHTLAADLALEQIRKKRLQDFSTLTRIYKDTLVFCDAKLKTPHPDFPRPLLISTLLNLMNKSQTILAIHKQKDWLAGIDLLRPLLKEELQNNRSAPIQVAQFAELLMRESTLRRTDPKKSEGLKAEAMQWLDQGLKNGKERNLTNLQLMPFNILAANVAFATSGKRANMAPYLQPLQETRHPHAEAVSLVLDGAADELEGRLEKARYKLEKAVKIPGGGEEIRAHAALANVYMSMGQPEHALISLSNIQRVYERYEDLSNLEKEWIGQFLRSPQDLYALMVVAHLESARNNIIRYFRQNPRANNYPRDVVKDSEDKAKKLIDRDLPSVTAPGLTARIAWINYLVASSQRDLAEKEWTALNRDYSDRLELLTLKANLMRAEAVASVDPKRIAKLGPDIDNLILTFIKTYPSNISAKLYWSLWLSQTKRVDQALANLKEITETGNVNPEMRRVAAAIILSYGQNTPAMRLISHLPRDPQIDQVMVDLGNNIEKQRQEIRAALTRHEVVGLGRTIEAEELYQKGEYAKAAAAFLQSLDFTRIKGVAQQGLIRSMFAYAGQDAEAALALNKQMLSEFPEEPILLLTSAYIYLVMENVGAPTDNWELRRTMGSALNIWERLMARESVFKGNTSTIPLTRAEFWFRANRPDVAKAEIQRALNHNRQDPAVLAAFITTFLDDPAQDNRAELREYFEDLKKAVPQSPVTYFLQARIEEFTGNTAKAIQAYESLLEKFPKDRAAYLRFVDVLDNAGDYDRGLRWVKTWRAELPTDLQAVSAEVRFLARKKDFAQARVQGSQYLQESLVRASKMMDQIKDSDPKKQDEKRTQFMEFARWKGEFEIARGFYLGGALDEAEGRLSQIPKTYSGQNLVQETLGEIYIKQKQWAKAEVLFEQLFQREPRSLVVANNLAYILAVHRDKPAKALDVIREVRKGTYSPLLRTADRFPPEFLDTVGTIYVKLDKAALAPEMIEFFKDARQRYPNDPRIWLYLGVGTELSDNLNEAERFYNTALQKASSPLLTELQRVTLRHDAETYLRRVATKTRGTVP